MSATDDITQLNRRWRLQVNLGTAGAPTWTTVPGIVEIKPTFELRREDDETTEDAGAARQAVTGHKWGLEIKLHHRTDSAGTTLNAAQEKLRTAGEGTSTLTNEAHIRYFDRNDLPEAYEGYVMVDWNPAGGGPGALAVVEVKLTGQGARSAITNPA